MHTPRAPRLMLDFFEAARRLDLHPSLLRERIRYDRRRGKALPFEKAPNGRLLVERWQLDLWWSERMGSRKRSSLSASVPESLAERMTKRRSLSGIARYLGMKPNALYQRVKYDEHCGRRHPFERTENGYYMGTLAQAMNWHKQRERMKRERKA